MVVHDQQIIDTLDTIEVTIDPFHAFLSSDHGYMMCKVCSQIGQLMILIYNWYELNDPSTILVFI